MRHSGILILFLCIAWAASAQKAGFDFNQNCRDAYRAVLRYDLETADRLTKQEYAQNPLNAFPLYLENYGHFLKAMVRDEKKVLDEYSSASELRLERLKESDDNSPYYRFCLAEIHIQNAMLLIKQGSFLQGAIQLRQCYRHLEANMKAHPNFLLTGKTLYPLRALIGAVPSNYRWLLSLLGYEADLTEAIRKCENLRQDIRENDTLAIYYRESTIILCFLQLNLMNNSDEAWRLGKEATPDHARNELSAFVRGNIAINLKKNEEALAILRPHVQSAPAIPHLDYLMGNATLQKLQPQARTYFLRYTKKYKGGNYIKDSYLRIGWSYLLEQDTASYRKFMLITEREGSGVRDEDKQAMKEISMDYVAVPYLLKSRLLFDGGYYALALKELEATSPAQAEEHGKLSEYYYRRARIYHHSGKAEQALHNYKRVINTSKNSNTYFAPASCYFSGLIYEEQGNAEKAAAMFNACLAYDNYSYKKSFDQKATAALKRIQP
ncbi:MAG: hypothetical protein WD077_12810 [Bacteroidia bacterium]